MNLKDFTAFLKLPIAKLIIGFFFAVVIAQGYTIYILHSDSNNFTEKLLECQIQCNKKMGLLQTEIKEELRNVIKIQQQEIEKSKILEEKARQQQETALKNQRSINQIKHDIGI